MAWCLLGVVLLVVIGVRVRLLDVPLERDEGEYAYIGQRMLRGVPPYAESITAKFPGTPAMYALAFIAFGQTIEAVHLGLLVANLATALVLYRLVARWHERLTAAMAAGFFAVWSLSPGVQGSSAHAENFGLLFGMLGFALAARLVDGPDRLKWHDAALALCLGVVSSLAVMMKQQTAFFVAPAVLYMCLPSRRPSIAAPWNHPTRVRLVLVLLGAVLPMGALHLAMWGCGVYREFWFFTVTYARQYAFASRDFVAGDDIPSFARALQSTVDVFRWTLALDVLALFGLASLEWDEASRRGRPLYLCLLAGGVAAMVPGFFFRPHYYIYPLPALSYCAALGLAAAMRLALRHATPRVAIVAPAIGFLFVVGVTALAHLEPWFELDTVAYSRAMYGDSPFPEAVEVARFLQQEAAPTDRLFVFGSEPQLYFYTGLPVATRWIYTYSLVNRQPYAQEMQAEAIEQVERSRPEYCVVMAMPGSWAVQEGASTEIFDWWNRYQAQHYELIGVADMIPGEATIYRWGDEAREYRIQSDAWIGVYRRRTSGQTSAGR